MAYFTKDDLLYFEKYTWDTSQAIDPFLIDKKNGHQVLHFANRYAERYFETPLKGDLHKIEYMLAYKVPATLNDKNYIAGFIKSNW